MLARSLESRMAHSPASGGAIWPQVDQRGKALTSPTYPTATQTLKIVTVITRGLSAHMEPSASQSRRLLVNSNLASVSIVADPRFKVTPIKVDLSAPIELLFRHLSPLSSAGSGFNPELGWGSRAAKSRCVYWDTSVR